MLFQLPSWMRLSWPECFFNSIHCFSLIQFLASYLWHSSSLFFHCSLSRSNFGDNELCEHPYLVRRCSKIVCFSNIREFAERTHSIRTPLDISAVVSKSFLDCYMIRIQFLIEFHSHLKWYVLPNTNLDSMLSTVNCLFVV